MDSFKIANYKVSTYIQRLVNETRFERILELEGEPVAHGYVSRATLVFSTFFTHPWSQAVVGYLTYNPSTTAWINIAGWMDLGEYEHYYRILQSEKPVSFYYQRQNAGTFATGYLTKLGLGTGSEPIGEGPAEATYKFAMIGPALQQLIADAPKASASAKD